MSKETLFYGVENQETLDDQLDECVERYFNECSPDLPINENLEILVQRYKVIEEDSLNPLQDFLEQLDEEYGPNDDFSDPTPKMIEAKKAFVKAVISEYQVWRCEPTGETIKVNLREWCARGASGVAESQRIACAVGGATRRSPGTMDEGEGRRKHRQCGRPRLGSDGQRMAGDQPAGPQGESGVLLRRRRHGGCRYPACAAAEREGI